MKITINRTFNYGYRNIWFRKDFEIPYPPFIGLSIIDTENDQEINLELVKNDYIDTCITYYPYGGSYHDANSTNVEIRENWKFPVTEETVDNILESYIKAGWERRDTTDAEEMKQFMYEQYMNSRK